MITEDMIREGYSAGIVRVIDSPHGDGAVCQIGDYWFYFWNSQDFSPAEEFHASLIYNDLDHLLSLFTLHLVLGEEKHSDTVISFSR